MPKVIVVIQRQFSMKNLKIMKPHELYKAIEICKQKKGSPFTCSVSMPAVVVN